MTRFTTKVVLITGAGSIIGRTCAVRLAAEGDKLYCTDIQQDDLASLVQEINAAGGTAVAECFDVSALGAAEATVAACVAYYSKLGVVVNMAGILRFSHCHEASFAM